MAAGLTDQAIARQLAISERTVQRRIQRICERLGVTTRFQAGLQTARQRLL
jgi:DNA-binding NarL/FixJ family response regulator